MTDLGRTSLRSARDDRPARVRPLVGLLVVLGYAASAAAVRLFDTMSVRAQTAQLVREGGPLHAVAADGLPGPVGLLTSALTDWRALVIFGLVVAGALTAALITTRVRRPR